MVARLGHDGCKDKCGVSIGGQRLPGFGFQGGRCGNPRTRDTPFPASAGRFSRSPGRWKIRNLDIENDPLQADGFCRGVLLRTPAERGQSKPRRIWKSYAPAYNLNDASVAFLRFIQLWRISGRSRIAVSGSIAWPCLHCLFRNNVGAVGATATHIDDILGSGERDVSSKTRVFQEHRFGRLRAQETPFAHVGVKL